MTNAIEKWVSENDLTLEDWKVMGTKKRSRVRRRNPEKAKALDKQMGPIENQKPTHPSGLTSRERFLYGKKGIKND